MATSWVASSLPANAERGSGSAFHNEFPCLTNNLKDYCLFYDPHSRRTAQPNGALVDANRHLAYLAPPNLQAVFDGDELLTHTDYFIGSAGIIRFKNPPKGQVRFLLRTAAAPNA